MKIHTINTLVIEITRRCNMCCAHCLRGDAQNLDIETATIDLFVNGLEPGTYIGSITFTGGEPSLNISAMEYTRKAFEKHGICVGSFYTVTNGKANVAELAHECLNWYTICDDGEFSGLALSQDSFHDKASYSTLHILRGLSFFRENDKKVREGDKRYLISEGRAATGYFENAQMRENAEETLYLSFDEDSGNLCVDDGILYLNALGDIISGCDWSYESQAERIIVNIRDETWVDNFCELWQAFQYKRAIED